MVEQAIAETTDDESRWQSARLIPTSGIKGADEQEKRATSALLSVMMAVPEYSRALLRKVGAPAGGLRAYIEPEFKLESGGKLRPDGILLIERGRTNWRALVEVKTGTNELQRDQIEGYLDLARGRRIDCVITISNQLSTVSDNHPLVIDRKKTRSVALHHLSWVEILSEAVMQREHRGISDPDQAWILGELIAYLEHPQSGAMEFQDMGPQWVTVRDASRDGTLRARDLGVNEIVVRWDQFIQYLCLFLMRDLGVGVKQILSRREESDASHRKAVLTKQLCESYRLSGVIRVKQAVGDITLTAALRPRTVTAAIDVAAPTEGRPTTRVSWLLRQLRDGPDTLRIDAAFVGSRGTTSCRLGDARRDPNILLLDDRTRPPRSFSIAMTADMGMKRAGTKGSFISGASELLLSFYRAVVQELRAWNPPAAKLPDARDTTDSAHQPENVVVSAAAAALQRAVASRDPVPETPRSVPDQGDVAGGAAARE